MIDSNLPGTRPAPWDYAAPWGARGYITDLDGPVHWIEFTAKDPDQGERPGESKPPIVFVHGLGGSHLNWCLLGPHLAAGRRAVARSRSATNEMVSSRLRRYVSLTVTPDTSTV